MAALIYDLTPLNALVDGNEKFRKYLIELFIQTTPPILEDLKASLNLKDFEGIYAHTHKVKPTLDSMGMIGLRKTVDDIMKYSKMKVNLPELQLLINHLCSEIGLAITQLQTNEL
ncbi:MAG: Hpt domain-containing protein [Opitutaceae bacterium]|nr:Hpt domain-containing protein [Cytophagales bacterium]